VGREKTPATDAVDTYVRDLLADGADPTQLLALDAPGRLQAYRYLLSGLADLVTRSYEIHGPVLKRRLYAATEAGRVLVAAINAGGEDEQPPPAERMLQVAGRSDPETVQILREFGFDNFATVIEVAGAPYPPG